MKELELLCKVSSEGCVIFFFTYGNPPAIIPLSGCLLVSPQASGFRVRIEDGALLIKMRSLAKILLHLRLVVSAACIVYQSKTTQSTNQLENLNTALG